MNTDLIGRYATLAQPVEMRRMTFSAGESVATAETVPAGVTVKIVTAFRKGDVGFTDRLDEQTYLCRLDPVVLAHIRNTPEDAPAFAECYACKCKGLIRLRCSACRRLVCDCCTLDDELASGLCYWCQPTRRTR